MIARPAITPEQITCSECGETKPFEEFTKDKARASGRRSRCKKCGNARYNEIYRRKSANPEFLVNRYQKQKLLRANNIKSYLLKSARARSKKAGIPFSITEDDFEVPDMCPIFKIPLAVSNGQSPNSPSLDRIEPSLGYVPGNVQVISWRANRAKGDQTFREMLQLAEWALTTPHFKEAA